MAASPVDPDFAREVLADLYGYRRKRAWIAWLLWLLLGWTGGHRFYLERHGTALLMMFTGGGMLVWWVVDAVRVMPLLRRHNEEQARRQRAGEPPIELDFMPPLDPARLAERPPWMEGWLRRSRRRRRLRLAGDVTVLLFCGWTLGMLGTTAGAGEAVAAVLLLSMVAAMGAGPAWTHEAPVVRSLVRWSHRLRLFHYFNEPGSPAALLVRSFTGALLAPFRKKALAEVRLYLSLGLAFTLAFLVLDVLEVAGRMAVAGARVDPTELVFLWFEEAAMTFVATYAFAAPVGAILNVHLLTRDTHTVPRLLSALTVLAVLAGVLGPGWGA
ncbi:MAG: TM2 domain-containing protein [Gemmatimonadetes bacterium]|nr:TM2 domain-containing protein [Gemmatimonadota bacterium]